MMKIRHELRTHGLKDGVSSGVRIYRRIFSTLEKLRFSVHQKLHSNFLVCQNTKKFLLGIFGAPKIKDFLGIFLNRSKDRGFQPPLKNTKKL